MTKYEMHLRCVEARGLPDADILSKSDPFCVISLSCSRQLWRSRVIDNNLNPVWNEDFHLQIADPSKDVLQIRVKDNDDTSEDDALGKVLIDLGAVPIGQLQDQWVDLDSLVAKQAGGRFHYLLQILEVGKAPDFPPVSK
jgi:Ca2+-dependent lipid-binding protein